MPLNHDAPDHASTSPGTITRGLLLMRRNLPTTVLIIATLTALAAYFAFDLSVDTDLSRLLPASSKTVQGLHELEKKWGSEARVSIVFHGAKPAKLRHAVDALAAVVAKRDDVVRVQAHRPVEFLKRERLLYLDRDDLGTIAKRLTKRVRWEKAHANPLFVSLGDDKPPSVDFAQIEHKYDKRGYGGQDMARYFHDDAKKNYVLFVYPKFPPSNLERASVFFDDLEHVLDHEIARRSLGVHYGIAGMYKVRADQQAALSRDLPVSLVIAFVGVMLFLCLYFRSLFVPLVVVAPLIIGTVWAFGFAGLVMGSLNVLTAFCGAILLGLGVDYGIHLVSRYREARVHHEPIAALAETYATTGKASLYAGLTTLIAFGSLSATSFRAFFEFGILSVAGLSLILVAYIFVLPCVLLLLAGTRFEPSPHAPQGVRLPGWLGGRNLGRALLVVSVALVLVATLGIDNVRYDYQMHSVQLNDLDSVRLDAKVRDIVKLSRFPAVVLADSAAHAQRIAAELRRRRKQMPEGDSVARVLTADDLLPSDQAAKLRTLETLAHTLNGLPEKTLHKHHKLADLRAEVDRLVAQGRVHFDDLPRSMSAPFRRRDGVQKAVVLAFPSFAINDARPLERFAKVVRGLPGPHGEPGAVDGVCQTLLLVDILDLVKSDAPLMFALTLIGLLICGVLGFGEARGVLVMFATLSAGIYVALGFLGIFDVAFNFINVLILPIWLGLGVDASFHLMMRRREAPHDWNGYLETNGAVAAAFITSTIGFGSMLTTEHEGLSSLGAAAVIGLSAILVMSLLVQAVLFVHHETGEDA